MLMIRLTLVIADTYARDETAADGGATSGASSTAVAGRVGGAFLKVAVSSVRPNDRRGYKRRLLLKLTD